MSVSVDDDDDEQCTVVCMCGMGMGDVWYGCMVSGMYGVGLMMMMYVWRLCSYVRGQNDDRMVMRDDDDEGRCQGQGRQAQGQAKNACQGMSSVMSIVVWLRDKMTGAMICQWDGL